jgi:hypothetical protein
MFLTEGICAIYTKGINTIKQEDIMPSTMWAAIFFLAFLCFSIFVPYFAGRYMFKFKSFKSFYDYDDDLKLNSLGNIWMAGFLNCMLGMAIFGCLSIWFYGFLILAKTLGIGY